MRDNNASIKDVDPFATFARGPWSTISVYDPATKTTEYSDAAKQVSLSILIDLEGSGFL